MTTWESSPSNAHVERAILTGMIMSDRALRVIGLSYKPQYLTAAFSREVAKWCLEHLARYGSSPKADIQTLFEAYRRNGLDQETARLVAQLLSSLSQEFERSGQFNEQLCIDTAASYFRERGLTLLKEDLEYHLEGGNVNAAHASVAKFVSAPELSVSLGIEPLADMDGTREAFEDRNALLELPGDLGRLLGPLEREWTVMVVGKYKGAKSYTCQHIAQQALYSGLNVGWFDFELGERRLRRRFAHGICAAPLKAPRHGRILKPVWDCVLNQTGECSDPRRMGQVPLIVGDGKPDWDRAPRGYRPCTGCTEGRLDTWFEECKWEVLDWRTAWRKSEAVAGSVMGARLKVCSWPKFSAGVDDVEATLQVWQHLEGFMPDVIVVDQPDIMRMEGKGDTRQKIDELWKRLGAIPQKLHCLLVAPSQAGGKDAQERKRLRDSDVAEDSRKLGHVDMSIKIDQTEEERDAQRAIYSIGVGRDDEAVGDRVMVLQCLALGQAVLDSRFIGSSDRS
jgi:hypothetical protein